MVEAKLSESEQPDFPENQLSKPQWRAARDSQAQFLAARPLISFVYSETVWGPAHLDPIIIAEYKEVAETLEKKDKKSQFLSELADMAILLLTLDLLDETSLIPTQKEVKYQYLLTIQRYLKQQSISEADLIAQVEQKIQINELRNPPEAFSLVPGEDYEAAWKRFRHNWGTLKEHRPPNISNPNWWQSKLYVDPNGKVNSIKLL